MPQRTMSGPRSHVSPRQGAKIQRLLDLITTLLAHRYPLTFDEIAQQVPGYRGNNYASLKRMFERDKQELKSLGIPISTPTEGETSEPVYALPPREFYLPYLTVATARGYSKVRRIDRYGYRALTTLTFEADELEAIAEGAQFTLQLGDDTLAGDVRCALRKLMFDLPLDDPTHQRQDSGVLLSASNTASAESLYMINTALTDQKRLTFQYYSIGRDNTSTRTCEPYGIFFINGHWYCAARDVEKDTVRSFRVNRMTHITLVKPTTTTAEYTIPRTFDLRAHAQARLPWQLGAEQETEVIVEFEDNLGEMTGAVTAAAALGTSVVGAPHQRRFRVRRLDSFIRWLLSLAGDAIPIAPEHVVTMYRGMVDETYALYTTNDMTEESHHG